MPLTSPLRGFWKLSMVEFKIFLREPLGVVSTIGVPILIFLLLGRSLSKNIESSEGAATFLRTGLPVLACILMALGAVASLIAIISIYREGGILKRLRATPLQPVTILGAHVFLKLGLTALTLALLVLAGKRYFPGGLEINLVSFTAALLLATLSILSIGFVIASAVPTARFAQPIGSTLLYSLLAISGLFRPVESLPVPWRQIALASPITHAVSLMNGIWSGGAWSAHLVEVGALLLTLVLATAISAKIFRWE